MKIAFPFKDMRSLKKINKQAGDNTIACGVFGTPTHVHLAMYLVTGQY